MDGIRELLLPRTDGGVAVQAVALIVLFAVALVGVRDRPDARLVVIGLGVVTLGLVGLRAAH